MFWADSDLILTAANSMQFSDPCPSSAPMTTVTMMDELFRPNRSLYRIINGFLDEFDHNDEMIASDLTRNLLLFQVSV